MRARCLTLTLTLALALAFVGAIVVPPAAAAQPDSVEPVTILERPDELVMMMVAPKPDDGSIALLISSHAPRCRFPESVFELPIQINGTGFQLKHAIRPEQRHQGDGSCLEAVATSYHPAHYWPLKNATSVTLYLPGGPIPLNDEALAQVRAVNPARPAENLDLKSSDYITVINRLTMMLQAGEAKQVREAVEGLLPAFATRPPEEGFAFFALLGMARRLTGDLAFAASSYEVATMLGMLNGSPNLGVVYDNLSTARRLQKQWPEAERASDQAIASLEAIDQPEAKTALGGALNNRAMLLMDQQRWEEALPYSERALAILKEVWKDRPKQLAPFLDDNRRIREKLGPR